MSLLPSLISLKLDSLGGFMMGVVSVPRVFHLKMES